MWWKRILFGRVAGRAGVPIVVAVPAYLLREYFENWLWSVAASSWRELGLGELPLNKGVLAITAAILIGLTVFGIFVLGEWWGKTRRPQFFRDRPTLEARYGARPLADVETAHCVWLSGQKVFRPGEHLTKIKKLILPDPGSHYLSEFTKALPNPHPVLSDIKYAIESARKANIEVRLYREFTGKSWWIGDRERSTAFVHIECLIPHAKSDRRPSFRVYRWQDEEFYNQHCQIFDWLWDNSDPPQRNGVRVDLSPVPPPRRVPAPP